MIIEKMVKVFDFIESSDEILSTNITDYIELIHKETGIHPLEIIRNEKQLIHARETSAAAQADEQTEKEQS